MTAVSTKPLSGTQLKARLAAIGLNCVELVTSTTLPAAPTLGRIVLITDAAVPYLQFGDGQNWQTAGATPRFATLTAVNTSTSRNPSVRAFNAVTFR